MHWTEFFLKKPVFSISITLMIIFFGFLSINKLPLRLFPKMELSIINITVNYPGATAETMRNSVANTIESALYDIENVNYITSKSTQNRTIIHLYLDVNANSDIALVHVMEKVSSIRDQLPNEIESPLVSKENADDSPLLILAFSSNTLSRADITDYLNRDIKLRLESISGVASSEVLGDKLALNVYLDPNLMSAYQVGAKEIISALKKQNFQSTIGNIDDKNISMDVKLDSDLSQVKQFNDIMIKHQHSSIVRLKEVSRTVLGNENENVSAYYNGQPTVMLFVKPALSANPMATIVSIRKLLSELQMKMPSLIQMNTVVDATDYIYAAIKEVFIAMLEAILIVSAIMYLFTASIRVAFVPILTIPIALLGTCFILSYANYSLNLLTLLAMVIAIGLVVDDAIVVIENIYRHLDQRVSVFISTAQGMKEIAFPVISMTLMLAAVFSPVVFSHGMMGSLFSEFAVTLSGSVLLSGIVALTLSPIIAMKVMKPLKTEVVFLKHFYKNLLEKCFHYQYVILSIWIISILSCVYFYISVPKELAPKENRGFFRVLSNAPSSTNQNFLMNNTFLFNSIYNIPEKISSYVYVNGIPDQHQALSFIHLSSWKKQLEIDLHHQLRNNLAKIAGIDSVIITPSSLPIDSGLPLQFVIKSVGGYKNLYKISESFLHQAKKSGLYEFLQSDLHYGRPLLKIKVDREAAVSMGVNISDINQMLSTLFNKYPIQYFSLFGRRYPIVFKSNYSIIENLDNITVPSESGLHIPISALVTLKIKSIPESLNQFQKFNSVTFSGVMSKNHSLSEGLEFLEKMARKIFPSNMSFDYSGPSRQYIQERHQSFWLLLSGFFVIYIILTIQFENFRDPWIILFGSVPMALSAALLSMKLGMTTLNIYTQMSLLTLMGLISKHGILLINVANKMCVSGFSKKQAIFNAAELRFRPILMTTLSIVFGVLPLVFSSGAGYESRFSLGITITMGMIIGTIFTLFIMPILYYHGHKS
ncbi:MAG: hypothetical protein A3F10_00360 [Coxiella sp. RIFCSPHIGHO2_12_FULL_42_15]|nr:MAG: hypothetical protein A3F10_00360 [Coxiella sp. RIFCSPHIGHO2_12_FULL_42_15]